MNDTRAASVVTRRDLEERLPRSAPDALRFEPGVYVQQTAHGQALKRNTRLPHQPFFRPVERAHKQQVGIGIATPQFLCHSQCRKDMPASAAGCQEDVVHVSAVREKFISRPTHSIVAKRLLPP